MGVQYVSNTLRLYGRSINATVWDTVGHELFARYILPFCCKGAHAILFMYDVTKISSLKHLEDDWMRAYDQGKPNTAQRPVCMLVACKADLGCHRAVSSAEGEALAESRGWLYVETSARHDIGVQEAFGIVIAEALKRPALMKMESARGNAPGGRIVDVEGDMDWNRTCTIS